MKTAEIAVELIDSMGSDLSVCNAARVSFAKESNWVNDHELTIADAKLIAYLAKHNHWSPFAHCFASFRIKAPIFVARQLAKHQVGLAWNEESRRYIDEEPEFYFPKVWRGRPEGSMKQGSSEVVVTEIQDRIHGYMYDITDTLESTCNDLVRIYTDMIEEDVAPEQARMILPQNTMTNWIWSGSLMAFARVCNLRLDPHAQAETSEVAAFIDMYMRNLFPVSWTTLVKGGDDVS